MKKIFNELNEDKFALAASVVAVTWVLLQIVLMVIAWDHPIAADGLGYSRNAIRVVEQHALYPSKANLYDMIIHSPGIVNYLAFYYAVFGTLRVEWLVNLLMNVVILYEIFYLAKFFFGRRTGYIATIIYCCIVSTWFVSLHFLSDHPSFFLFITGFCLSIQKRWYWIVLGGICYAFGYTIRPTVLGYIVTSVLLMIVFKRRWHYYLCLLIPYIVILYGIGKYFEKEIGVYVNSTYAYGFCLKHAANEETWAGPNMAFFTNPHNSGYIENASELTFVEKDSIWMARTIEWVKENPERYLSLAPQRLFRCFALDDWTVNDIFVKDAYGQAVNSDNPSRSLLILRIKQALISVPYYIMLILFLYSIIRNRKDILTTKGAILLITLLYAGTTFLTVAEHRSHYAFLFPLVIWAAYGLDSCLIRRRQCDK